MYSLPLLSSLSAHAIIASLKDQDPKLFTFAEGLYTYSKGIASSINVNKAKVQFLSFIT